jgi:hypothetical protein
MHDAFFHPVRRLPFFPMEVFRSASHFQDKDIVLIVKKFSHFHIMPDTANPEMIVNILLSIESG